MSIGQAQQTAAGRTLPSHVDGLIPYRLVPVDAARLLLLLAEFAHEIDDEDRCLERFPPRPVARHFTPEYYLQKLDFLVRYPGYFAYELASLHKAGDAEAGDAAEMRLLIKRVLTDREPVLHTLPFERFWRGAYERLDDVESWWYSRTLVFTCQESRGSARPQKHYFVTEVGLREAARLCAQVTEARWYADRITLIKRFFGRFTPAEIKNLQYRHASYRDAQFREAIPDLTAEEIRDVFADAFGIPLEVDLG